LSDWDLDRQLFGGYGRLAIQAKKEFLYKPVPPRAPGGYSLLQFEGYPSRNGFSAR